MADPQPLPGSPEEIETEPQLSCVDLSVQYLAAASEEDVLAERVATDTASFLDDGRPPPELGRLHRGALAGRAAADADEVEIVDRAHSTLTGETRQISSAYCRIVRSLENVAMLATFRMAFLVHADSSP